MPETQASKIPVYVCDKAALQEPILLRKETTRCPFCRRPLTEHRKVAPDA